MGCWIVSALLLFSPALSPTVPQDAGAAVPDEARFQELARRYHEILTSRPQRGTAFDMWFRLYVDAGRLEELAADLERAATELPEDFATQVIAGLVYERRGDEERAAAALERAEALEPDNYYPAYLRGTLLAAQQKTADAAAALERAIKLKPPRGEHFEISKRLARLYLRDGKTREATATLADVAEKFPGDRQVIEELAELLTEEEQFDEAARRWEEVAALAKDDLYRRMLARVEIAQIQVRQGVAKAAITTFDQVLDQLDPESWLAKEIARRVEEVFLQKQDLSGLATYLFERLARHPDELGTMVRLAAVFAQAGKSHEAVARFHAAIKLAPSRRDIRESLVRELVRTGRFADAIVECDELAARFPDDVEVLRTLGQLHLDAASGAERDGATRDAVGVWRRIAAIRPNDATLAVQVAEACRRAARLSDGSSFLSKWSLIPPTDTAATDRKRPSLLVATAEEFYREAVRRAPGVPQYHEYLGEFLQMLGRRDDAIHALAAMTAGANNTAENWHRLAEVFANFNYLDRAIDAGEESLAREPDNFGYRDLQVSLFLKKKGFDRALEHVVDLDRLADTPFLQEKALNRRVEIVSAAGRAEHEVERLRQLERTDAASLKELWMLALLQAQRFQYTQSAATLERALRLAPDDVRLLQVRAGMLERAGNRPAAVQIYRRLVQLDRKNPLTYYERIAQLELDLGRAAAAKEAADSLIRLAPANLEAYRLKADVAFRLRDVEAGLAALRQAVRIAPRDTAVRQQLAKALADNRRFDESMEHYWRSFELEESLPEKLSLIKAMSSLPTAGLDGEKLIERLRQVRRRADDPRVLTLCIVEAMRLRRDYVGARRELTELLAVRRDDLDLLKQLTALAEEQKDWSSAVGFQERIVALSPNRENLETLARYHKESGDEDAEERVWARILDEIQDDSTFADAVERLAMKANFKESLRLAEFALAKRPDDWRLLFWAGCSHFVLGQTAAAQEKFEALLALPDSTKYDKPGGPSLAAISLPRLPTVTTPASNAGQIVVSQAPPMPIRVPTVSSPELDECSAAKLAAGRFTMLRQLITMMKRTAGASSGTVPSTKTATAQQRALQLQVSQRSTAMRMLVGRNPAPQSQRSAKIESMIGLWNIGSATTGETAFIAAKRAAAKEDPAPLRDLLLVFHGMSQEKLFQETANELIVRLPDDPLPHVARLSTLDAAVRQQPQAQQQQDRQIRYETLHASFDWLAARQPALAEQLNYYYCYNLIGLGFTREAGEHIAKEVDAATHVQQVLSILGFAQVARDPALMRKVFLRTAELAGTTADPAVMQQFAVLLTEGFLTHLRDEDLPTALSMFHQYMENTQPRPANSTARRTSRTSAAIAPGAPSMVSIGGNVIEFPCPSSLLEANRFYVLAQLNARMRQAGRAPQFAEHLARQAERSRDRARLAYKIAEISVLWWHGDRVAPIEALEQLADELPGDPEPRVLLAKAHYTTGNQILTLKELTKLRDGDRVLMPVNQEVELLRSAAAQRILTGPLDQMLAALMIELEGEAEPQVGPFVAEAWQAVNAAARTSLISGRGLPSNLSSTTTLAGTRSAAATIPSAVQPPPPASGTQPALPAATAINTTAVRSGPEPSLKTRLPELLDFARREGKLDALERKASEQWQEYPGNLPLGTLTTLARFAREDVPSAHDAARRWADEFATQKKGLNEVTSLADLQAYPELWMIASACVGHAQTRTLSTDLMRQILEKATRRGWVEMQQSLLADMTRGYIDEGKFDEARNLLEQVVQLLETDPSLARASLNEVSVFVVYRLAVLAGRVHPSLVPTVLEMIAGRVANDPDKIRQPWLLTIPLADAMTKQTPSLAPNDRRRVIAGLKSIVFGGGAERDPLLFTWREEGPPTVNGGLGRLLVEQAQAAGELDALRREWARLPATTIPLLVLRAEAALAAGDHDAADKLRTELAELERKSATEAPLWSAWFLFRGFDERLTVEFRQDFRGTELDKKSLELTFGDATTQIDEQPEGLRIRIPPGTGNVRGAGVNSRFQVHGDFEVTVNYEILDLPRAVNVAGLVLQIDFGDSGRVSLERSNRGGPTQQSAARRAGPTASGPTAAGPTAPGLQAPSPPPTSMSIQRVNRSSEGNVYTVHRAAPRPGRVDHWERYYFTEARTGKLRLVRRGVTVYYLVAEGSGDEFRLLQRSDSSGEDVRTIRVVVEAQTPSTRPALDVRVLDLTVRAEAITKAKTPDERISR